MTCSTSPRVANPINDSSQWPEALKDQLARSQYYLALTLVVLIVHVVGYIIFHVAKAQKYDRLKVNRRVLVLIYAFCMQLYVCGEYLPIIVGVHNIPCWFTEATLFMVVPFMFAHQFTRNATFIVMTRFARATILYGRPQLAEKTLPPVSATPSNNPSRHHNRHLNPAQVGVIDGSRVNPSPTSPGAVSVDTGFRLVVKSLRYLFKSLLHPESSALEVDGSDRLTTFRMLKFLVSLQGVACIFVIVLTPYFIMALALILSDKTNTDGCYGCPRPLTPEIPIVVLVVGFPAALFGIFFAARVRQLPDEFRLQRENRLITVGGTVSLIGLAFTYYFPQPASSPVDLNLLTQLGTIFSYLSMSVFPVVEALRDQGMLANIAMDKDSEPASHSPHQGRPTYVPSDKGRGSINSFGPGSKVDGTVESVHSYADSEALPQIDFQVAAAGVSDIPRCRRLRLTLTSESLRAPFIHHLEHEMCTELLFFILDTWQWRIQFSQITTSARLARARKIVGLYIRGSTALFEVNLPGKERAELIRAIDNNAANLQVELFDKARFECADLLERGPVARFLLKNEAVLKAELARSAVVEAFNG